MCYMFYWYVINIDRNIITNIFVVWQEGPGELCHTNKERKIAKMSHRLVWGFIVNIKGSRAGFFFLQDAEENKEERTVISMCSYLLCL